MILWTTGLLATHCTGNGCFSLSLSYQSSSSVYGSYFLFVVRDPSLQFVGRQHTMRGGIGSKVHKREKEYSLWNCCCLSYMIEPSGIFPASSSL